METDKEIYNRVEREVDLMILEIYEGIETTARRKRIMNFVTKAIRKTIDAKNSQSKATT